MGHDSKQAGVATGIEDQAPAFPYGGLRLSCLDSFRATPNAHRVRDVLFGTPLNVFVAILIVYAVIVEDVRVLVLPMSADFAISTVTLVVAVLLLVELVLLSVYEEGYFLSFYWICDAVATATLLLDVNFVALARYARLARFLRITRVSLRVRVAATGRLAPRTQRWPHSEAQQAIGVRPQPMHTPCISSSRSCFVLHALLAALAAPAAPSPKPTRGPPCQAWRSWAPPSAASRNVTQACTSTGSRWRQRRSSPPCLHPRHSPQPYLLPCQQTRCAHLPDQTPARLARRGSSKRSHDTAGITRGL